MYQLFLDIFVAGKMPKQSKNKRKQHKLTGYIYPPTRFESEKDEPRKVTEINNFHFKITPGK